MNNFSERLINEKRDLQEKLSKLNDFLNTQKFNELSQEQKNLLTIQSKAMDTYLHCLESRLANL